MKRVQREQYDCVKILKEHVILLCELVADGVQMCKHHPHHL